MLQVKFFIACDTAFVNKDNGNINLIGVFDEIGANEFPTTIPTLTFVAKIFNQESDKRKTHTAELTLWDEHKEIGKIAIENVDNNPIFNLIFNFVLWPFEHEGVYTAKLRVDDEIIGVIDIPVKTTAHQ
jgi:hypothetical protein